MSRSANCSALVLAAVASIGFTSKAQAIIAIPTAGYGGGLYGTEAVTSEFFYSGTSTAGGQGVLSSSIPLGSGTLAASADLSSGVLTAYSAGGYASASEWDTFTFTGLPAGGATITAYLSINGVITGTATGIEDLSAGPSGPYFGANGAVNQSATFNTSGAATGSIEVQFTATDASSITIYSEINADASAGNVADLGDPPTLTLDLPDGVTATPASGVFSNFQTVTEIPEPATSGLLLTAVAAIVRLRPSRRARAQAA